MGGLTALLLTLALALQLAAAASDTVWVTCGSTIKLAHSLSGARLHSHEVAYSRGSQQQSVTGFPESGEAGSYWVVHGSVDAPCTAGSPIKKGQQIRLQHGQTRKWLHSHHFYSPISGNQEISAFGSDTSSDGGDVWLIEWDSKSKHWKQDGKVRLKHKDTSVYVASNKDFRFGQPIHGQQEIFGVGHKSKDSEWYAAEGVYLPRGDAAAKKKQAAKKAAKDNKQAAAAGGGEGGKEEL